MKNNNPNNKNHIFRFKNFDVTDTNCGQKIGTDGVLLGSVAALKQSVNVLDIGTGSGIIALMIAQKQDASIDAVEIDQDACIDANKNFSNSPYKDRIKLYNRSIQDFTNHNPKKYDLIVCNPPFFHNSYKSEKLKRDLARHSDFMPFDNLFECVCKLLEPGGVFLLITPYKQDEEIIELTKNNALYIQKQMIIRPTPEKHPHRIIHEISKQNKGVKKNELTIETGLRHNYTKEYIELTRDYYLNM